MDKSSLKAIKSIPKRWLSLLLASMGLGLQREFAARLEEQKRQSDLQLQRELTQVANHVAQDIRGPLMALTTLSHLSHEMNNDKKELLQVAVARIRGIVDDLLKRTSVFSATEVFPVQMNSSDLVSVVEPLLKEYKFSHPQTQWSLHNHLSSNKAMVDLNTVQLQRILSHILNNAIEAVPEQEASIEVTLMERSEHFLLQIIDNGYGIPESKLVEVRESLKSLGGELQMRSREGVGTQVILLFPKRMSSQEAQVM